MPKQWRIYNIFYISLLDQNTTKKRRIDKKTGKQLEFEASSNNKEYEVEDIHDSAVYTKESKAGHLPSLYYFLSWKNYSKDKST